MMLYDENFIVRVNIAATKKIRMKSFSPAANFKVCRTQNLGLLPSCGRDNLRDNSKTLQR